MAKPAMPIIAIDLLDVYVRALCAAETADMKMHITIDTDDDERDGELLNDEAAPT